MRRLSTTCFGEIDYPEDAVFRFPSGLPGFESEREFVFLQRPHTHPLMFLQSAANVELCFILLPILVASPDYRLSLSAEDLAELRLPPDAQPRIGEDILCAALVCAGDGENAGPTVNLAAPVVVNLKEKIGVQAIQSDSGYSCRHPLPSGEEAIPCS